VAVHPTNVHVRLSAQRACSTVQGKEKRGLDKIVGPKVLKKYAIPWSKLDHFKRDLRLLGVTSATLFPDLDNLARDLADEDLLTQGKDGAQQKGSESREEATRRSISGEPT
jgi:hypothetical protein